MSKTIARSSKTVKKLPLTATSRALDKMYSLLTCKSNDIIGIKVCVQKGGCAGYKYKLCYVNNCDEVDKLVEMKHKDIIIKLFIDPSAILLVFGSEIDYINTDLKQGFMFNNPNKKGECGCGESFNA